MKYYNPFSDELKDERLEIVNDKIINNTKYIFAILHPSLNPVCSICSSSKIIKYGKRKKKPKVDILAHYKTDITIEYSRFKCKDCAHIFDDTSDIISRKDNISRSTKFQVLLDLKEDLSFTYIANKNNISIQSVINIFEAFVNPKRRTFPDVICMDEFKNLRSSNGKYAFLMLDPNSMKVIDVLEDRRLILLEDYFYKIPWPERNKVKYIVTDMYEGYRTIKKKCFPNATHVVDAFHFIRYVEDAFNNVRIRIQSSYPAISPQYKILKRYWRLLSIYIMDVEGDTFYNPINKSKSTPSGIITDSLLISSELSEAYSLCQDFLKSTREVKYEDSIAYLTNWITSLKNSSLKEFNELAHMFSNWKFEISNSFIRFGDKRLHNGYIEGINNRVKVIKRISYGYRNFHHFRARIMYVINDDVPLSKVDTTKIIRKSKLN